MGQNIFDGLGIEQKRRDLQLLQAIKQIDSQKRFGRNDEFGLQSQDSFQVRLSIPDLGFVQGFRRIIAKLRHADDRLARAYGKQHFGDARGKGYDTLRSLGQINLPPEIVHKRAGSHVGHERHAGENALLSTFHGLGRIGGTPKGTTGHTGQHYDRQEQHNARRPVRVTAVPEKLTKHKKIPKA